MLIFHKDSGKGYNIWTTFLSYSVKVCISILFSVPWKSDPNTYSMLKIKPKNL